MKMLCFDLRNKLKHKLVLGLCSIILGAGNLSVSANQPPDAQFTVIPTSGENPLQVSLDANASSDPDGHIVEYNWSAAGQTTAGRKASMTFTNAGTYDIELVVIDEFGFSDTAHQSIIVIPKVKANFTVTPDSGTEPLVVTLDAGTSNGNIIDYEWSISDGQDTQMTFGGKVTWLFQNAGTYSVTLTVTSSEGGIDTYEYPTPIVVEPKDGGTTEEPTTEEPTTEEPTSGGTEETLTYNTTARLRPQIIAAGVTPSQLDMKDDHFDIVAIIRPGISPIRVVSFQDTVEDLRMGMRLAGVLPNGDEVYKLTFTYERGSMGKMTFSTAWGSKEGQFNIVATDEAQQYSHTYPYLMVGNFPTQSVTTQATIQVNYDTRVRYAPQVIMAGYSPAILDISDDQLDIIAVVRPGALPIKHVILKQNQDDLFRGKMELAGEMGNGDKVYKLTYTYEIGSLGTPNEDELISYKDLWGPDALQFGVEVIDDGEQHSHKFPNIEFGVYPEFVE